MYPYIYMYLCITLSLSLCVCIYIYICSLVLNLSLSLSLSQSLSLSSILAALVNTVIDHATGQILKYCQLMEIKEKDIWLTPFANKLGSEFGVLGSWGVFRFGPIGGFGSRISPERIYRGRRGGKARGGRSDTRSVSALLCVSIPLLSRRIWIYRRPPDARLGRPASTGGGYSSLLSLEISVRFH